jgi:hypothetical protein
MQPVLAVRPPRPTAERSLRERCGNEEGRTNSGRRCWGRKANRDGRASKTSSPFIKSASRVLGCGQPSKWAWRVGKTSQSGWAPALTVPVWPARFSRPSSARPDRSNLFAMSGQVSPTKLIGRSFGQMVMEITCYMTWKTGPRAMLWMTMGLGSQSKMRLWGLPFGGLIEETGPASQGARRLRATNARPHISLMALPPGLGLLRSSACGTQMCPDHCSSNLRTS